MKNSPKNFYNVVDKKKLGIDNIAAVAGDVAELKSDVSGIETTLGNADNGLVKQVNDLQTTVDNIDYDISRKADTDGTYPDMTVGNADQLNSTQMVTDKVPYVFRTSGGANDIGNRENDKLVGGSIVWNQLLNESNYPESTGIFTNNGDGTFTADGTPESTASLVIENISSKLVVDHKYYIASGFTSDGSDSTYEFMLVRFFTTTRNLNLYKNATIAICGNNSGVHSVQAQLVVRGGATVNNLKFVPQVIDLTQMFGSDVADQLYTLEQAQSGSGVALFRSMFPKDYYAYNAGQLMSVKAIAHEMVGFNQWDEQWEFGAYNNDGEKVENNNVIRSKNVISIIPGMSYYFRAPLTSPVLTIRLVQYDANMNCLSSEGGLGINRILTLDSECRYIAFNMASSYGTTYNNDICINLSWSGYRNGEYEPYVKYSYSLDDNLELRGIAKVDDNGYIYYDGDTYSSDGTVIRNYEIRAYASGDESLPDAITDGTNTVVKLDTTVEESADPFQDPQWVDDFGTEEYVDTRDIPVPVGHITQYPANLRDKLQHLPSPTGVDGDYIIREDTQVMTLVPAPTGVPELPSVDGTYVLTCTVSDGTATLSWTSNS